MRWAKSLIWARTKKLEQRIIIHVPAKLLGKISKANHKCKFIVQPSRNKWPSCEQISYENWINFKLKDVSSDVLLQLTLCFWIKKKSQLICWRLNEHTILSFTQLLYSTIKICLNNTLQYLFYLSNSDLFYQLQFPREISQKITENGVKKMLFRALTQKHCLPLSEIKNHAIGKKQNETKKNPSLLLSSVFQCNRTDLYEVFDLI